MSDLTDLQRTFQAYLLDREGAGTAMAARIVGAGQRSAEERLEVYHDAYRLRLMEALDADFTTLHACLGDESFQAMAFAYIEAFPSHHPSIRWFGGNVETFLRSHAPWQDYRVIADVAALDWAISLAFDADDAPVLTEQDMMNIAPEAWPSLRFGVHPSVQTCDLEWNVGPLRIASDEDEPLPEPERSEGPVRWLVWRCDMQAQFRSMNVDEAFSLQAVRDGASFADICEGLCEWIDAEHAAMHAAGTLRQWVVEGVLSEALAEQ